MLVQVLKAVLTVFIAVFDTFFLLKKKNKPLAEQWKQIVC